MISIRIFCARSIVSALFGRFDWVLVAAFTQNNSSEFVIAVQKKDIENKTEREK